MKKIMFNDRYGLTESVLQGRKTMTRRNIPTSKYVYINFKEIEKGNNNCYYVNDRVADYREASPYKIGEIVAVAQAYGSDDFCRHICELYNCKPDSEEQGCMIGVYMRESGWNNKMFVKASLMPHQIFITDVRVERLQDISEEDCMKEGINPISRGYVFNPMPNDVDDYHTPREAYAALIDKVSGKGTWESNPWVFVYDFKLIK